jgi:hypothetical protein
MKNIYSLLILVTLLFSLQFLPQRASACNRSEISLDSLIRGPLYTDIYLTMSVGGGITGIVKGGGGDTYTFAFLFHGSPTFNAISYPASIWSDTTKANYSAFNAGAALGASVAIGYLYNGVPFTCVSTTAACGNAHTDVKHLMFRFNELPDSLRLAGIEGAGGPFAGCYPDQDMLIDFTNLPVVWANVEAVPQADQVQVKWTTASESNNDYFEIERSPDGTNFMPLARIPGAGNSTTLSEYAYTDVNPSIGTSFYRITQTDIDGKSASSPVVEIQFGVQDKLGWMSVGPNPFRDHLRAEFTAPESGNALIRLIDIQGRTVLEKTSGVSPGLNTIEMDNISPASGLYFLEIQFAGQRILKRLVNQS